LRALGPVAQARLLRRGPIVVATLVCAFTSAPAGVTAAVVVVGVTATTALVVPRMQGTAAERALLVAGGVLVAGVLTGLLVTVLPSGLTVRSWVLALGLLEFAAIVASLDTPAPALQGVVTRLRHAAGGLRPSAWWYVAAAVVAAAGIIGSIVATVSVDAAPLSLSVEGYRAGGVVVAIDSDRSGGQFTLTDSATSGRVLVSRLVTLREGHPDVVVLPVTRPGPVSVRLTATGSTRPAAQLSVTVG
jgi:hypothetical protein